MHSIINKIYFNRLLFIYLFIQLSETKPFPTIDSLKAGLHQTNKIAIEVEETKQHVSRSKWVKFKGLCVFYNLMGSVQTVSCALASVNIQSAWCLGHVTHL